MGYEIDQTPLPQKGDLSIVLDGSVNPVLVIETVSVVVLPFNKVSEQFAFEEGEGELAKRTAVSSVAPQKIGRVNMRRFRQAQNCQKFFTNRR